MLCDQNKCTGCGACAAKCSKSVIKMEFNKEGFLEPSVDQYACIHCGQCESVCPVLNLKIGNSIKRKPQAYVFKYKNKDILFQSASGGAFTALAMEIIEKGGEVFGAAWQKNHLVRHGRADQEAKLEAFRGSKYVQSDATETYSQVKILLEEGKPVLFTGVPCQIAGLYGYLGQEYSELYTVDLVCHGGGSPQMFCDHLKELEQQHGAEIKEISHTYKKNDKFNMLISKTVFMRFADGTEKTTDSSQDAYLSLFLKGYTYRRVCYGCPFAKLPRVADITIGDFMGFGSIKRYSFDTTGGISQVLINTNKGKELFERIKNRKYVAFFPVELWDCIIFNHNIWKPSSKKSLRDELYRTYVQNGFPAVRQQYYQTIKNSISCQFRKFIKTILGIRGTILGMWIIYSFVYSRKLRVILSQLKDECV